MKRITYALIIQFLIPMAVTAMMPASSATYMDLTFPYSCYIVCHLVLALPVALPLWYLVVQQM